MQNTNIREVKTRDKNTIGKSPTMQIVETLLVTAFILFKKEKFRRYIN